MLLSYVTLRYRQQDEYNAFPKFFAGSRDQWVNGMTHLRLLPTDTRMVASIGGNWFIRNSDLESFNDMLRRHKQEIKSGISEDGSGRGFILDMFNTELAKNNYRLTWDLKPTLDFLGLTVADLNASPALAMGLRKAIVTQWDCGI